MMEPIVNAATSAKVDTMISVFPETVARIAGLERMVATLQDVNLQLARRVVALERAATALA
jgi:hypothetical protein